MSDQPKPMTGHHPSCRESDKDLVWHCNQCGLNESAADIENQLDQPKSTTGEWTAERVRELIIKDEWETPYQALTEAINAALAAEADKWRKALSAASDLAKQTFIEKDKQLAAERERAEGFKRELRAALRDLAAERGNAEKAAARAELAQIQLAAARENVQEGK